MKDNQLYITIGTLKAHRACADGLEKTIAYFGSDETKLILLSDCFKSNPKENVAWALQATTNEPRAEIIARLWACDCVEQVLHLSGHPDSYKAIAVARSYALGLCGEAAWAAAGEAARAAAWEAARAAARAAAREAAWEAARAAAETWQYDRLRWYLEGGADWLIDGTRRQF